MLYKLLGALTGQLRVELKHLNPVNEGGQRQDLFFEFGQTCRCWQQSCLAASKIFPWLRLEHHGDAGHTQLICSFTCLL